MRQHDMLPYDPLPYLLGSRQPAWVKYRALTRLLGRSEDDPEVLRSRKKRDRSAVVAGIRSKQSPDGSFPCMPWMHIHKYYFHQMLEMGYGLEDETVKRSADNLLNYQLPDGGYMHPHGRKVNTPNPEIGWSPCVTGYVTKALMDLGLGGLASVGEALKVMMARQQSNGGWICRHVGRRAPYCIISGTPWVFACLAQAGLIHKTSSITRRALRVFAKHKEKMMRHGYHRRQDRYYRCDETLLLPSLHALGFTERNGLVRDLSASLLAKQQPEGYWLFRGQPSGWYTMEAVAALQSAEGWGRDRQIARRRADHGEHGTEA